MEVLTPAFATHPAFAPGTPTATVEALLGLMLDKFGQPGQAYLHGIRREGALACAAISLDLRNEPTGRDLMAFFYGFWRIMGLARLVEFARGYMGRPRYDKPYLELFLLGTTPGRQKQGLGREMLRFLFDLAREQGFAGVVLTAARHSPACGFYAREGFVVDSEVRFRGEPMVNMRRDNGD
jgi:GNAT superfamily N-acetyltransferase